MTVLDGGASVNVRAEASIQPSLEEKAALELIRKQSLAVEKAIGKVKEGKHGRVGNVFKMREVIEGNKKKTAGAPCNQGPQNRRTHCIK